MSVKRIDKYLNSEELDEASVTHDRDREGTRCSNLCSSPINTLAQFQEL